MRRLNAKEHAWVCSLILGDTNISRKNVATKLEWLVTGIEIGNCRSRL